MKKTILSTITLCLLSVVTSFAQAVSLEVKAFYQGHEDGSYFFEDQYGEGYEFTACSKDVLEIFELTTEELISQAFLISYVQLLEDDKYDDLEILKMKKIILEKIKSDEEDLEDEE
jgi:hypothetical protein